MNWVCKISHIWIEGNRCADLLAAEDLGKNPGFGELPSVPPALRNLLMDDLLGPGVVRFCF